MMVGGRMARGKGRGGGRGGTAEAFLVIYPPTAALIPTASPNQELPRPTPFVKNHRAVRAWQTGIADWPSRISNLAEARPCPGHIECPLTSRRMARSRVPCVEDGRTSGLLQHVEQSGMSSTARHFATPPVQAVGAFNARSFSTPCMSCHRGRREVPARQKEKIEDRIISHDDTARPLPARLQSLRLPM